MYVCFCNPSNDPWQGSAGHDLFVSFAGGGIYFFWQLGAVKFLQEKYDLTKVPMAGASSGSLVACLSACGVDPDLIVEEAYQLSIQNDIWNRKFGLLGIWGGLIRNWLDKLLPDNAHELVSHRLHVIIAKAPTLNLFEINQFDSKEDLIEAVMASAHVPFFLDGRPFLKYRGELCWDGSFPDFFYFENSELLQRDGRSLIVDYSMDEELEWTRGDFLKLRDYDEILGLIDKGYKYMLRQHEQGLVEIKFDTKQVTL
eukprot:jgi/Ulvmu1/1702/UM116_0015.1